MAAWAVSVVAWVAYLAFEAVITTCEFAPGTSIYGHPNWTWLPPGTECTYDERATGGFGRHVDPPPSDRLGIALVFVLWPITLASVRAEVTANFAKPS